MFGNSAGQIESSKPCRRDPEEILESLRKRKETLIRADSLLLELAGLPVHFEAREAAYSVASMLGEVTIQIHQLKQQEDRLLNEINEEAAK